ncbi:MAG: ANTAR domain-containing protein [Clostridia bacterium]|nr:ANTAR domain-containing protein [Clostridia bacterium]
MNFKQTSYSVLIVSAAEKFNSSFKELFPESKYYPIQTETNLSAAKRALLEREFDFIAINSPFPDGDGIRFAIDICSHKNSVVLLLVRNDLYNATFYKVSPYGVYVLPKPTSRHVMNQALDWMASTRERLRKLEKKNMSLEDKMQELRIINRAKWILIDQLKMSEFDAHRYIEKQAMDRCISKKEIAEEIIKTYT